MLTAALVTSPTTGSEESEAAFRRGVTSYEAGQHAEAIAAFEQAYDLEPKPIYLFSWAQSEVAREGYRAAVELFRRYLESDPPEANREAAEARIAFCEEQLKLLPPEPPPPAMSSAPSVTSAAPPPPTSPPAPPPTVPPPTTAAPTPKPIATTTGPDEGASSAWWTDPLALSLFGGGVVATGVGLGVFLWGQGNINDARDQSFDTYQGHDSALDAGGDRRTAGVVMMAAGGALVAGGLVRALVVGGDDEESSPAGWWLSPTGRGLVGRF